jgi:hypothetical protein
MEEELNKEYVEIITQMRKLNKKRVEVFEKFKEIKPDVELKFQRTVSIYHDLYGKDIDENI